MPATAEASRPQKHNAVSLESSAAPANAHHEGTSSLAFPAITVPSGGGAIKSMNEAFNINLATGTAVLTLPIPITKCPRWGTPEIFLQYDTGAGNGVFGVGWALGGLPYIERKTSHRIPTYVDDDDSFLLKGETLVPKFRQSQSGQFELNPDGSCVVEEKTLDNHRVRQFLPRVLQTFQRIEQWTNLADDSQVHWRVITSNNETQIFGANKESKVCKGSRVLCWLLCEAYDCHGGAQLIEWKQEDGANVNLAALHEQNRTEESRLTAMMLKRIKYGNSKPSRGTIGAGVSAASELTWHFEVVFDYGDHQKEFPQPTDDTHLLWPVRKDPFSTYTSGFEIRTYRLCRRVLMYHKFPGELGEPCTLVSAMEFVYNENESMSKMTSACYVGYNYPAHDSPVVKRLPPLDFEYTQEPSSDSMRELTLKSLNLDSSRSLPTDDAGQFQWVDLQGEGIAGLIGQHESTWYYKRNLSAVPLEYFASTDDPIVSHEAHLGITTQLLAMPQFSNDESNGTTITLADVDGDGLLDLVVTTESARGYYQASQSPEDRKFVWQAFRPFQSWPNINMQDPNLCMIDLTGNGRPDLLIGSDDRLVWYESLGFEGFARPQEIALSLSEEKGPRVIFSDGNQKIYLSDFSGDGLVDIARIRNSEICYWPNLGYGHFGQKISMDNAPVFDSDGNFSHTRLLICDLDGSGTTDIVYCHTIGVTLYFNQSGNHWSDGHLVKVSPSPFDSLTRITAVDLFGAGTTCLVYSSTSPQMDRNSPHSLLYVDLMNGIKPHLLSKWSNNRGLETEIFHRPSTTYYLADEAEGRPWTTRLPFPIQCVHMIIERDLIRKNLNTRRYRYHDGHYDGSQQEFRGFGMVEHWDSEDWETFSALHGSHGCDEGASEALHSPPIHSKTWYHNGAFTDVSGARGMCSQAFFPLPHDHGFLADILSCPVDKYNYNSAESSQVTRALSGRVTHQEDYEVGGTALFPFAIHDISYSVRLKQPLGQNKDAVFQIYSHETINYEYEQDIGDPRVSQVLTLEVDDFSNSLKSVDIKYGRLAPGGPELQPEEHSVQQETIVLYNDMTFSKHIDSDYAFVAPRQSIEKRYQLHNFKPSEGAIFRHRDFVGSGDFYPIETLLALDFHESSSNVLGKRLIECGKTFYLRDDLQDLLPLGEIEPLILPGQHFQLCITPPMMKCFQDMKLELPSSHSLTDLLIEGGYVDLDQDGSWWIPSSAFKYAPWSSDDISFEKERAEAKKSFYQPRQFIDPFQSITRLAYDDYMLVASGSQDMMGNRTSIAYDYRVLKPFSIIDPNQNYTEYMWDAIGRLSGIARRGEKSLAGDSVDGLKADLEETDLNVFYTKPEQNVASIIMKASTRFLYDDNSFRESNKPTSICQIDAVVNDQSAPRQTQLQIIYHDAKGEAVQIKSPALDGQWLTSGWTIHNNKGFTVQEYERFFDDSPLFNSRTKYGYSSMIFYDGHGRPKATLYPDHTWSKTEYGTWSETLYDKNDLTLMEPSEDSVMKLAVSSMRKDLYSPSWYLGRRDGALGPAERDAAMRAAKHADTPTKFFVDSLGNKFMSILDTGSCKLKQKIFHDVLGNITSTIDARGRLVTRSKFDMKGHIMVSESMDMAPRYYLTNVDGNPLIEWTGTQCFKWHGYDLLRRPLWTISKEKNRDETCILKNVYGDSLSGQDVEKDNLRGRLYKQYDQSGIHSYHQYNLDGQCTRTEMQLCVDYTAAPDWSSDVEVEKGIISTTDYDALGRIRSKTTAGGSITYYDYGADGKLNSVKVKIGSSDSINVISRIKYDAHGRETMRVQDINQIVTRRTFDPVTQRLVNEEVLQRDKVLQHHVMTYDSVGNLVQLQDLATHDNLFQGEKAQVAHEYTYDAGYRLIQATGREDIQYTKGKPPQPGTLPNIHVGKTDLPEFHRGNMGRYVEKYQYDEAGNMISVEHAIPDTEAREWAVSFQYHSPSLLQEGVMNNRMTLIRSEDYPPEATSEFQYDSNGNPLSMPGLTNAAWNCFNHLRHSSFRLSQDGMEARVWFVYDNSGKRVRKVVERQIDGGKPQKLKDTIYYEGAEQIQTFDDHGQVPLQGSSLHVIVHGRAVALFENWCGSGQVDGSLPSVSIRFQHRAGFDSISFELDEAGQTVSYEEYTPYGNSVLRASSTTLAPRYRYDGKELDPETNLYYFHLRYYASWLCRWLNPDPIGTGDGLNLYGYVHCNPIRFHDSSGTTAKLRAEQRHLAFLKRFNRTPVYDMIERSSRIRWAVGPTQGPVTFHRAHLIPKIYQQDLKKVLNIHKWVISVPARVNLSEMKEILGLDEMAKKWLLTAAPRNDFNGESMTNLEWLKRKGDMGIGSRLFARNVLLNKMKELTSTYMHWGEVLDYRGSFTSKIRPVNFYPDRWKDNVRIRPTYTRINKRGTRDGRRWPYI